jgi:hypothetical protein
MHFSSGALLVQEPPPSKRPELTPLDTEHTKRRAEAIRVKYDKMRGRSTPKVQFCKSRDIEGSHSEGPADRVVPSLSNLYSSLGPSSWGDNRLRKNQFEVELFWR